MNNIEKSIFHTIAWFDIFNFPLTAWEVYKFQIQDSRFKIQGISFEFEKIQKTLKKSEALKEIVGYKHSFYFLKLRDELVKTRKERYIIAEKKYKKLLKISRILAVIPFIRAIAAATGLSYSNSKKEDDIDLFIITAKNRIWLVRFFSILILKLFRARPTIVNKKDKICLNFFITEENLNLEKIMLSEKNSLPDIYFIYWLVWLYPIYQEENIWQEFIEANNWLKNYFPNSFPQGPILRRTLILKPIGRLFKKFCEKIYAKSFGSLLGKTCRWLQIIMMPKNLKELANQSASVIINNQMLKFHDQDKREIYREKFYEETRQIN